MWSERVIQVASSLFFVSITSIWVWLNILAHPSGSNQATVHDHHYDAPSTPPYPLDPPYPIIMHIKWMRIMFRFHFSLFARKQQYISPKLTNFKIYKNCSFTVDRLSKPYVWEHSNIVSRRHIWDKKSFYIKWISFFPGA